LKLGQRGERHWKSVDRQSELLSEAWFPDESQTFTRFSDRDFLDFKQLVKLGDSQNFHDIG
jgi:hypothetical protein